MGRLSAEKDIERLKPMLEGLPGTRLALIGDGPHRKVLEKHFTGLPVHMAGFLRGEELATAFASGDVFVMPSRTETLGLVVLEAMSAGLPVVGARAGGIPEMIVDGVTGALFETEGQAIGAIRQLLRAGNPRADRRVPPAPQVDTSPAATLIAAAWHGIQHQPQPPAVDSPPTELQHGQPVTKIG